jgi:cellobiose transport system permease protein
VSRRIARVRAGADIHGAGPLAYALLTLAAAISAFPLYYMLVAASRSNAEIAQVPPPLTPGPSLLGNLRTAFTQQGINLGPALLNTLVVAGSITLGTVLFSTLAGFAFAKLRFRYSAQLLGLTVATMMVPTQLGVIPLYRLMARLQWANHLQAVILPSLVSAFGVFFMTQYLRRAVHAELLEAAVMDGAGSFRAFRSIVLPLARPAMAVLGMITFLAAWNDYFWPLIVLSNDNPTVQVALDNLGGGYVPDQSVIMAGTLAGTLPVLVVFLVLGRQIVGGIMQGAVKG